MVARKRLEDYLEDVPEKPEKPKRGRPSTYQARYAKIAKLLCSRGAIDADLADAFDVTTVCIQKWQSMHPDFGKAVREGKAEIFDPRVERALAQRALGYAVDTEEVKITKDGDIIRYDVRKHFPPDTTACIFWLKNRQPAKWRDVWKIDHEGKIDINSISAEQLLEDIRKEAAALGIGLPAEVAALGVAPTSKANGVKSNGTKH